MRRGAWILGAVGLVAAWALYSVLPNDPPTAQGQRSGATTGYLIEDGTVAWRPMSGLDKFVVNILTLGQAANSTMVNGRTLGLADPESFQVIEGRYGLDSSRAWLEGVEIAGADPATFQVLSRGFAHDNAQLWKGTTPVLPLVAGEHVIEVPTPSS